MAEDLKHLLIETNPEFRELASKHHTLDDRLHELEAKHYLSAIRRSQNQETQTPPEGSDGEYSAELPQRNE